MPNERKSNEEKIMDLIAQNGYVVRSDVDQLLDVSQTTASRILKRMVTDGLIYQDGSGRKTKYRKRIIVKLRERTELSIYSFV